MCKLDNNKTELIKIFQQLTVKQRIERWADAFEFISKLPQETRQMQRQLRNKRNRINTENFK